MIWVAVFQRNLLFESSRCALKMDVVGFFIKLSVPDYFVTVWKETFSLPFGLKLGHEMEEGQGLVLNSSFAGKISHVTFYRNMISRSV
jgi:hypothetical protein